jgi:hypothetical protein
MLLFLLLHFLQGKLSVCRLPAGLSPGRPSANMAHSCCAGSSRTYRGGLGCAIISQEKKQPLVGRPPVPPHPWDSQGPSQANPRCPIQVPGSWPRSCPDVSQPTPPSTPLLVREV